MATSSRSTRSHSKCLRALTYCALFVLLASEPGLVACAPDSDKTARKWRDSFESVDSKQSIAARFASIAENAISHEVVEGVQFALVEDGKVLTTGASGVADRESRTLMTVDTPINVASISKPLTAWGFMHLAEREGLDLDAPIRELLEDGSLYTSIFSEVDVSARMLLSHTSGLSGASVPVTPATQSMPTLAEILLGRSSVERPVVESRPGTRFSYSGVGYLVLQKAIEDQTDINFGTYMADAVLNPAQMPDSSFSLNMDSLRRVAVYYRSDGRRREPYHLPGAAGGLYSTANDMARFIILYTDAGSAIRRRIISDAGFAELLSPIAEFIDAGEPVVNLQYTLGHYAYETREGTRIVFHAGGNPGLRALLVVAPDLNCGFFAAANNDRGSDVLSAMLDSWGQYHGLTLHAHF